jgi:TPR repeat protein
MHCGGYINSEENRILAESRIQQHKTTSHFPIDYYSDQFKHYRSSNQEDPVVQLNLAFLYQHGYGVKK